MRVIEYCISDGEGTLLEHGYVQWSEPEKMIELISEVPKGAAIMFEEVDPDMMYFDRYH